MTPSQIESKRNRFSASEGQPASSDPTLVESITSSTGAIVAGLSESSAEEILGHSDISSTQIYTHVSIKRLQEVHAATHPSARLSRPIARARGNESARGQQEPGSEAARNEAQEEAS
jgi:hypothetical protein